MKAKQLANMYTKQYVQEVFEKRLREEGFACADDKYLCWYRVVNREVVNSIIFWAPRQEVPVWLEIGYGIFPLFSVLPYTQSVCYLNRPIESERLEYQEIVGSGTEGRIYADYSEDIPIYIPSEGKTGIYTFDKILLPVMNSVSNLNEAYQYHKQTRLKRHLNVDPEVKRPNELYGVMSETFMDMAVYFDDQEMYPYCEWHMLNYRGVTSLDESEEHREQLRDAILHGKRDEYLQILERRKEKNIRTLQKRCGITV